LVSSTLGSGPNITSFDPVLTGTLQMDRSYTQSLNIFSNPVVNQNTGTGNFSYLQGFQTGTNLLVGFNNTHLATRNSSQTYSPVISSGFQMRVTQHLLQGFGFDRPAAVDPCPYQPSAAAIADEKCPQPDAGRSETGGR